MPSSILEMLSKEHSLLHCNGDLIFGVEKVILSFKYGSSRQHSGCKVDGWRCKLAKVVVIVLVMVVVMVGVVVSAVLVAVVVYRWWW